MSTDTRKFEGPAVLGPDDAPAHERRSVKMRLQRAGKAVVHGLARPTSRIRPLPDFLIVGAQRGGTTSLYRYLCEHPAVIPAVLEKGVHYFDTAADHPAGWYRTRFPTRRARERASREAGMPVITGEASPYYLFHPAVPARARALVPEARIVVMLRDPVVRAHSHHQHERARGFERLPFEDAVVREALRLDIRPEDIDRDRIASFRHQHFSYVARGRYLEQLERWLAVYPEDRIHVVISEDLFSEPERVLFGVQRFLGLPERALPSYEVHNARSYPAMPERTRAFLREQFQAQTDGLRQRLGIDPPWSV